MTELVAVEINPNPNSGDFMLTIKEDVSNLSVEIIDVSGRLIYTDFWEGSMNAGFQQLIKPGNMEKGLYFIHLESENKRGVRKIIVQ